MYYSNGNYEAFARPRKPEGVDQKSAYLVGAGLASLAAACFLVRDGQMKGENIHILEEQKLPGGACDGINDPQKGFIIRGGREMENHFECLWDLFRSIPSIETPGVSVLDEYYWLNKEDPNYSLMRATMNRGEDAHTDRKFDISDKGAMEIMKLFFTPDEDLYDKKITDYFSDEVLNSNFWLYWRTMFAFENWHSALEMKLYIKRFIHHIGGLPDFTALRFTKYNQYESMILPMIEYLKKYDVQFHYGTKVENVKFEISDYKKSKYMFKEISEELEEVNDLLGKEKTLMAVCLLRNVFEEIMYIIATTIETVDIDIMTKASYFYKIVADHCDELLYSYTSEDIKELYGYMSKITHVTNVKEATSYLVGNKQIKKYINNEIKFIELIIENIYLEFINKKLGLDNSMCDNIMIISSYVDLINVIYFTANSTGEHKRIELYFYGEKNQKYLNEKREQMIQEFKEIQKSNVKMTKTINDISKELDRQIKEKNYTKIVKKYT